MRALTPLLTLLIVGVAAGAWAQTWVPDRATPGLWEIVSVDRSGEAGWPYAREDIAGDGLGQFEVAERRLDVRTLYAATTEEQLWVRLYVADTEAVEETMAAFLFIDVDADPNTGGSARVPEIWGDFEEDPSLGGYERILGINARGTPRGLWSWDRAAGRWSLEPDLTEDDIQIEAGVDVDPIDLLTLRHGYLQLSVLHSLVGTDIDCDSRVFLRVGSNEVSFSDVDASGEAVACVAPDVDDNGTPDVLEVVVGCLSDADCPGQSVCFEGRYCLFGYECVDDSGCRSDEACDGGLCVRIITRECADDADCGGLVCDGGDCVACRDSGARACADGLACAPIGLCVDVRGCLSDAECGAGRRCAPSGGCVDDGLCLSSAECDRGQVCVANGLCVDTVECVSDGDCDADQICNANHACVDGERACEGASDCGEGEICAPSGACVIDPSCQARGDCPVDPDGGVRGDGGVDVYGDGGLPPGEKVQGGACACDLTRGEGGGAPLWLTIALILAFLTRRRWGGAGLPPLLGLLALLLPSIVDAEPINTQRFNPAVTHDGFLIQEGTSTRFPIDPWAIGVWAHYGDQPLIVADEDNNVSARPVSGQLGLNLVGSYAFTRSFELGVDLPLGYLTGDDLSEGALGDLRLISKLNLIDDRMESFGLAVTAEVWAPTHTSDFYGGSGFTFGPKLLIDHRFGLTGWRAGARVGALIRESTEYLNVTAGSELELGAALTYAFEGGFSPVELLLDLHNAVGLAESDSEEVALEALGALRYHFTYEWQMTAGLGLGVMEGFGVPTYRALFGLRWSPAPNDPDGDGSPTAPPDGQPRFDETEEGKDGKPGEDGKDDQEQSREDAAKRGYDACPDLDEDYDGIEDDDGCPEGDADSDGVLDVRDICPDSAETINGFKDDDGCPDEGPARVIVKDGKIVVLETIRFKLNSDELEPESEPLLQQITLTLRARKDIRRVRIEGHTDNVGSAETNLKLSQSRARRVKRYLVEQGIKSYRLDAQGYGFSKPLESNETEEGRAVNRRVEFIIIKR